MNNEHTKVTDLSVEQQKAVVDTKAVLASKQDVLMAIGQVQAFDFVQKLVTVTELKLVQQIKESKSYKGLTYEDDNQKLVTVTSWDECCKFILNTSREHIDTRLLNLQTFGEEFFESSQRMGLGYRDLRKLRQLPSEEQALIINDESVDLGDKEAVKELIEELTFKQVTEKAELKKQVDEANQTVAAVRENSAIKQLELDDVKEREAKRSMSQAPWQHESKELAQGMLEARVLIEQGVNQLTEIFQAIVNPDSPLDQKAIDLLSRSIFSEATSINSKVYDFTSEVSGLFSGAYSGDLDAAEVLLVAEDSE